jgi:ATP synthase protein I
MGIIAMRNARLAGDSGGQIGPFSSRASLDWFDEIAPFRLEFPGFAERGVWRVFRQIIVAQVLSTAVVTSLSGWLAGMHGAISALLGGTIGIAAGLAFAMVAARLKSRSAGEVLLLALGAEALKIALIVFLLWLVFATYPEVVAPGLIGSFIVSILIFGMAFFFARDV